MPITSALRTTLLFLSIVSMGIGSAFAGGYAIPHQTAQAVGLSNAVTAGVTDPSAVYVNPAALTEVEGNQLMGGLNYINVINSVNNSGRKSTNRHDDNFIPTFFTNYHIPATNLTAGIGVYTPFGLSTTYDKGSFTRFGAVRSELRTMYLTPAIAWHLNPSLSLGGGFSFVHASALLSRTLCADPLFGCAGPLFLEEKIKITDTANAFTYNLGLLVKPNDAIKFGLSYRARADLRFDNADAKLNGAFGPATARAKVRHIPLPPVIDAGIFWQIQPVWGVEFVYEFTRWSEFKTIKTIFSPPPFGIPSFNLPQEWKNTSTLRLGSFYKISPNIALRGGIAVEETPIPNRRLNPAIPGADILTLNGGLGYTWQKWTFDLGYMAVFYKTRRISNLELEGIVMPPILFPFQGAPGKDKYRTFNNFVSLTLGYRF